MANSKGHSSKIWPKSEKSLEIVILAELGYIVQYSIIKKNRVLT